MPRRQKLSLLQQATAPPTRELPFSNTSDDMQELVEEEARNSP